MLFLLSSGLSTDLHSTAPVLRLPAPFVVSSVLASLNEEEPVAPGETFLCCSYEGVGPLLAFLSSSCALTRSRVGSPFLAICSVAERVAWERGESVGRSVGFSIRLENAAPRARGSIHFCTTGILLRRLQVQCLHSMVQLQDITICSDVPCIP